MEILWAVLILLGLGLLLGFGLAVAAKILHVKEDERIEEVAKRLVAKPGTEDYSSITLAVASWGDATITRNVSRQMFFPQPNVDSAVVTIKRVDGKLKGVDRKKLNRLVRASFAMRRKTLANNLSAGYAISKYEASKRIVEAGFEPTIRGERLSLDDYIKLSNFF